MLWLSVWIWLWWGISLVCVAILSPPRCCHWRGNAFPFCLGSFHLVIIIHKNGYWLDSLETEILCSFSARSSLQLMQFFCWRIIFHNLNFLTLGILIMWQCDPYFDQIGCSHPGCEPAYRTPKCVKKCVSGNQVWKKSKHYSVSAYRVNSDPHDIMAEVYKNGPVEVAFTVYEVNENSYPLYCDKFLCNFHGQFLKTQNHPI